MKRIRSFASVPLSAYWQFFFLTETFFTNLRNLFELIGFISLRFLILCENSVFSAALR